MTKKLEHLENLYLHELQDMYSSEKQITKALPKLAKSATADDLKHAFEEHLKQTQNQIERLERIFHRMGASGSGSKCKGMEGILTEGEEFLKENAAPPVHNAGMIVGAQKVEHYEIASYGSLCSFAQLLGYDEDLELLKQSLMEEKETDEKLNEIARSLNEEAEDREHGEDREMTGAAKAEAGGHGRKAM